MNARSLLVAALVSATPAWAVPARALRQEVPAMSTPGKPKVWNLGRPAVWVDGALHLVDARARLEFARREAVALETLRADEAFGDRFGKIIPHARLDERLGWLEQSARQGVTFEALSPAAAEHARGEMTVAIARARKVLGDVSDDSSNFLFDVSGKLTGWTSVTKVLEGRPVSFEKVRDLSSGTNAQAYEVRSEDPKWSRFGVIKILRLFSTGRLPAAAPEPVLRGLADEAARVAQQLRASPTFTRRFGAIVPETVALAPGVIVQELGRGVPYTELGEAQKVVARREKKVAGKLASALIPGVVFSPRSQNFLFDPATGKPTSWYDMISDGVKAYQKLGLKERVFPPGLAGLQDATRTGRAP